MYKNLFFSSLGLVSIFFIFQNCGQGPFSANNADLSSSSSESEVIVANPAFFQTDSGLVRDGVQGENFVSDVLAQEGSNLDIPVGSGSANIVNVRSQNPASRFEARGHHISVSNIQFSDSGVHEVTLSNNDVYSIYVSVVPIASITAAQSTMTAQEGTPTSIVFNFVVPDTSASNAPKYSFYENQDPNMTFEIKWIHKVGSLETEIAASLIDTNITSRGSQNVARGQSVLSLDSLSAADGGSYIATLTTRVGDISQIRSAQTALAVRSTEVPLPLSPDNNNSDNDNSDNNPPQTNNGGRGSDSGSSQENYGVAYLLSERTTDANGEGRSKYTFSGGGSPIGRSKAISECDKFIKNGSPFTSTPIDASFPHRANYYICVHAGEVLRYKGSVAQAFGPLQTHLYHGKADLVKALCDREAHQMNRAKRGTCN